MYDRVCHNQGNATVAGRARKNASGLMIGLRTCAETRFVEYAPMTRSAIIQTRRIRVTRRAGAVKRKVDEKKMPKACEKKLHAQVYSKAKYRTAQWEVRVFEHSIAISKVVEREFRYAFGFLSRLAHDVEVLCQGCSSAAWDVNKQQCFKRVGGILGPK
eukprot:4047506-Pleurochrysis_carterae.AAC.1